MITNLHARYQGNLPRYMTDGAAGADLVSNKPVVIKPGEIGIVETGTSIAFPQGTCGLAMPRSSICNKLGLQLVNSVGLIDSDYTGEILFMYRNLGLKPVVIDKGERIGQIVCVPYIHLLFDEQALETTDRGDGGHGSTGKY